MPYTIQVFLHYLLYALWIAIFARALLSWFDPTNKYAISRILFSMTEPVLAPIRRLLPATSIDFSPLIAIVIIAIFQRALSA